MMMLRQILTAIRTVLSQLVRQFFRQACFA